MYKGLMILVITTIWARSCENVSYTIIMQTTKVQISLRLRTEQAGLNLTLSKIPKDTFLCDMAQSDKSIMDHMAWQGEKMLIHVKPISRVNSLDLEPISFTNVFNNIQDCQWFMYHVHIAKTQLNWSVSCLQEEILAYWPILILDTQADLSFHCTPHDIFVSSGVLRLIYLLVCALRNKWKHNQMMLSLTSSIFKKSTDEMFFNLQQLLYNVVATNMLNSIFMTRLKHQQT